jgi:hypothetical protein
MNAPDQAIRGTVRDPEAATSTTMSEAKRLS